MAGIDHVKGAYTIQRGTNRVTDLAKSIYVLTVSGSRTIRTTGLETFSLISLHLQWVGGAKITKLSL